MRGREGGVALISVLLVMSLALLLTAGMLRNHRLVVQSSAQQFHQVQLRQLGFAGESWALQLLRDAGTEQQQNVHLGQAWARAMPPFEVEGGSLQISVEDLAARFNLSPLFSGGQVDQPMQQRWERLLALLEIDSLDLETLQGFSPEGGLTDLSQLRLLPGVDARVLQRLQPWVALLPKEASLNINTASAQQLMLLEGMTPTLAQAVVRQRPAQGYRSAQAFADEPLLAGLSLGTHGLGVSSRWFRVTVDVALGQSRLRLVSELERDPKTRLLNIAQRRFLTPLSSESLR